MKGKAIFKELDQTQIGLTFVENEIDEADIVVGPHDLLLQVAACSIDGRNKQLLTELFLKRPKSRLSVSSSVSGAVTRIGSAVTSCQIGDRVTGVLPLDSEFSGCGNFCTIGEFNVVKLDNQVGFTPAAACIGAGVKAYTALQYLGRVDRGETVLVLDAGHGFGYLCVQLALSWGAKVFAVVSNNQERSYLEMLQPPPEHVLEMDATMSTLCSSVLEETGKLGVDVIIDNGVRLFTNKMDNDVVTEDNGSRSLPSKQSIISCLAVGGRWVTSHPQLQLDPPDSLQLFLHGASVSFLFEHSWTMSASRQGKWLHIARDIVQRLAKGVLSPNISRVVPFTQALAALNTPGDILPEHIVVEMPTVQQR